MKIELLPSASTSQTTSNVLTKFRIQILLLAFSSEYSMNISPEHSYNFHSEL